MGSILPLFQNCQNPQYPAKLWLPTKKNNEYCLLKYIWGSIMGIFAGIINPAYDSIIFGFMIHGSGQLEMLKLRLKKFSKTVKLKSRNKSNQRELHKIEQYSLNRIIKHHQNIIQ